MKHISPENDLAQRLGQSADFLKRKLPKIPATAVVLGSGLGNFAENLKERIEIPYSDIPHFIGPTVEGHEGKLIYGLIDQTPVLALQGRIHLYEGHPVQDVVYNVRAMKILGIRNLLLSNAAGGLNPAYNKADLVILTDHINMMGINPLIGPNHDFLGTRFPDISEAYNKNLRELFYQSAKELELELKEGIYCSVLGPSYESPAEVRMFRNLGADLVGMSTVPEVLAAHHAGLKIAVISCVTNMASGLDQELISHDDVKLVASKVMEKFSRLLTKTIPKMR